MVLQATDQFTIFPRHTASSMVHMQAMVQLLQDGPCKMSRSPSTVSRDVGDTSTGQYTQDLQQTRRSHNNYEEMIQTGQML